MDEAELRDDDLHDKRMARLKRGREEKEALKAEIERLRAALDEADALIIDLIGMPWPAAYPEESTKRTATENWKARCVERGEGLVGTMHTTKE